MIYFCQNSGGGETFAGGGGKSQGAPPLYETLTYIYIHVIVLYCSVCFPFKFVDLVNYPLIFPCPVFTAAPPTVRRLAALREAITERGFRDQVIVQGIFIGPPRSGKSSLKDRLMGRPAQQHSSTGVADKVVRIEIDATQISGCNWKAMTDLDDEATDLVEGIPEEAVEDFSPPSEDAHAAPTDPTPEQAATKPATPLGVPELPSQPASETAPGSHDDTTPTFDPLQVFEDALAKAPRGVASDKMASTEECFTLYLTDSGGQPEFQGLLRSAVSGPTLFMVTFRLDKDLNTQYVVEYQHPDGSVMTPYETSFTTKETLLQYLATISSVGSFAKAEDEKEVQLKPKVLFVGTHRDQLASREQFLAIDRELQELIKTTDAYRDNLIEFASEEQLILPINNLSADEGEVTEIRAAVERIGRRGNDYTVRTPYSTLVFGIAIRYLKDPVLHYKDCFEVGTDTCVTNRVSFQSGGALGNIDIGSGMDYCQGFLWPS